MEMISMQKNPMNLNKREQKLVLNSIAITLFCIIELFLFWMLFKIIKGFAIVPDELLTPKIVIFGVLIIILLGYMVFHNIPCFIELCYENIKQKGD